MQVKLILSIIMLCTSFATYAAASGSLWGDVDAPMQESPTPVADQIDAPMQDPKKVVQEQMAAEAASSQVVPEKTVCDILQAQVRLDLATLNSSDLIGQLRTNIDAMPDEYKMLVSTNEAMGKLYQEYRGKYLKVYCTK